MSKVRYLMTQTVLVEIDEDKVSENVNFLESMNNGDIEILEIRDVKITTEDGIRVLINEEEYEAETKKLVMGDIKEVVEG